MIYFWSNAMSKWYYDYDLICHWCSKVYKAKKGRLQARFCCKACKQAHYRAYKKYVTLIGRRKRFARPPAVTQKKSSGCPVTKRRKVKKFKN